MRATAAADHMAVAMKTTGVVRMAVDTKAMGDIGNPEA
jgi:hypothetical protein